ncbi:MAG: hypothetical protein BZ151_07465 [Desulfobacca sp. 4484_104]|nr:MAG: hypothetical protein BZ151_07465 [Desulfobacca sp. 4484_104]
MSTSKTSCILNTDNGYALPVVLLISLIIMAISMSMSFVTRSSLATAYDLKNRSRAMMSAYSAMNEVIYRISTATFRGNRLQVTTADGTTQDWTLYGKPFALAAGVTIRLRDTGGMFSPLSNPRQLARLAAYVSGQNDITDQLIDTLSDWQDIDVFKRLNGAEEFDYRSSGAPYVPRNFFLQLPEELMLVKGYTPAIYRELKDELVYWGSPSSNYLTMDEKAWRALLRDDDLVEKLAAMREQSELTAYNFQELTGIKKTEYQLFSPSGWIQVSIKAEAGEARDFITAVILKKQVFDKPFMIASWKK